MYVINMNLFLEEYPQYNLFFKANKIFGLTSEYAIQGNSTTHVLLEGIVADSPIGKINIPKTTLRSDAVTCVEEATKAVIEEILK